MKLAGKAMNNPFPGMNPYLEDPALWPEFHRQLVKTAYGSLLPGLVDRYSAQIGHRQYLVDGRHYEEDFIEIRQRADGKLITLVESVSPANRTTTEGRRAYLEQRRQARQAGANLVEIDLVLQGQPMLDYSREGLPDWHYAVTVARANNPDRFEIYTATLQKRLPRFRMPLASDDRDTVVDLLATSTLAMSQVKDADRIDYSRDPVVPLVDEERRWLRGLLKAQGLRASLASQEEIALAAYRIWEQEGRPEGRDKEHWYRALGELESEKRSTE
jgi:hypothetical protein